MTVPLWLDPAPGRSFPALDGDTDADLVVLGGGMTGASAAFHAAERGLRAVLLEADVVAGGASGRNAGFLLAGPEAYYADTVAAHGRDLARAIWALNRRNRDGVAALAARLDIDCDLERTGSLVAAVSDQEADLLRRSFALQREDGHPVDLLDGKATDALLGSVGMLAGIHVPDDGMLHPARFVRGLAAAAARSGARVHERSRVLALERDGGAWVARTAAGRVRASRVVAGLNAYAPDVLAFARERVFPVRGQVLATAPVASRGPTMPVYADHGYLYVRPCAGRVVAGGMRPVARAREVGAEDRLDASVQAAIGDELARRWPSLGPVAVTHRWSGIMGFSRDGLPWIGPVPGSDGLLAAFGYTGHGWGYGVWAGEQLAAVAAGKRADVPAWLASERPLVPARTVF